MTDRPAGRLLPSKPSVELKWRKTIYVATLVAILLAADKLFRPGHPDATDLLIATAFILAAMTKISLELV